MSVADLIRLFRHFLVLVPQMLMPIAWFAIVGTLNVNGVWQVWATVIYPRYVAQSKELLSCLKLVFQGFEVPCSKQVLAQSAENPLKIVVRWFNIGDLWRQL